MSKEKWILELHQSQLSRHEKRLEDWVKRNDELMKIIVTLSSGIVIAIIPLILKVDLSICYIKIVLSLTWISFLAAIGIILYVWNLAINLDGEILELEKELLNLINKHGYSSEKSASESFITESNETKEHFRLKIEPRFSKLENLRWMWLVCFFLGILWSWAVSAIMLFR